MKLTSRCSLGLTLLHVSSELSSLHDVNVFVKHPPPSNVDGPFPFYVDVVLVMSWHCIGRL